MSGLIVHEWLSPAGGSENVFEAIAQVFPDAERWCLWNDAGDRLQPVHETVLARTPLPERPSEAALKSCIAAVVRQVAQDLRNSPAVCRKSYVNPDVFAAWRDGSLHRIAGATSASAPRRAEALAIALLERRARGRTHAPHNRAAPTRRPRSRNTGEEAHVGA